MNCQDNEYLCLTCKSSSDLTNVIAFEKNHETSFIPIRIRRTNGVGLIFTNNSIFYDQHVVHGQHHVWGKYQEMIDEFKKSLNEKKSSLE